MHIASASAVLNEQLAFIQYSWDEIGTLFSIIRIEGIKYTELRTPFANYYPRKGLKINCQENTEKWKIFLSPNPGVTGFFGVISFLLIVIDKTTVLHRLMLHYSPLYLSGSREFLRVLKVLLRRLVPLLDIFWGMFPIWVVFLLFGGLYGSPPFEEWICCNINNYHYY